MLTKLLELANQSCTSQGHVISWSPPYHGERTSLQNGICLVCKMEVHCNTKPLPNGIDIGGEAVALSCPGLPIAK